MAGVMPWMWVGPGSRSGSTRVQNAPTSAPARSRTTTPTSTIRSWSGAKPVVSTSTTAKPGGRCPGWSTGSTVDPGCDGVSHARDPDPGRPDRSGVGPDQLLQLTGHVLFVLLLVLAGPLRAPPAPVEPDGRDEHHHARDAHPEPVLPLLGRLGQSVLEIGEGGLVRRQVAELLLVRDD